MKILFLIQSCEQERYINEEQIARDTWIKRLRKNCDYCFYRGGADEIKLVDDVLYLNCKDDLENTYIKTITALSLFRENKYDFIIRLNTSNWINIELLSETIETLNSEERCLIGYNLLTNESSKGIPFLRGNFLLFSKIVVNDLFELMKEKCFNGLDDICIGLNLCNFYQKKILII